MSDYYTESQMQRIEQAAYDGATLEAGKEWERQRYEFDATEAKLVARIAELEAALTNALELVGMTPPPAFPEWIPVTAKLPEDGETVFVIIHDGFERFENGNEVARLTYLGNGNWWSWESERYVVTHWMPLPKPPEAQE